MIKIILLQWLVLGFFLISCSKTGKSPGPINDNGESIIDDSYRDGDMQFPGNVPLFVALIKLKNPALLSSISQDDSGEYFLDEETKNNVLSEQEDVVRQLRAISPDVKILYKYRMVLNGLAVQAPQSVADKIRQLKVGFIESNEPFVSGSSGHSGTTLSSNNAVSVIEADKVHRYFRVKDENGEDIPVKGRGVRVGVIDSGIDFTHKMFGGPGDPAVYESIDPSRDTAFFPTNRVKGGKDFVGDSFSTQSQSYKDHIPVPDNNPIDHKDGHGTHVAGILAGKGDGINTYDGVAPEAELYALKVSAAGKGSSKMIIIAALEYAADPNEDMSVRDRLDVVNISMERAYGNPQGLFVEAIENLAKAGVVVVAAAGNRGSVPNIVGAPGVANSAISVAASSASSMLMENYTPAVQFQIPNHPDVLAEFKEGDMTVPVSEALNAGGKLFYVGLADRDLTGDEREKLRGRVALIDRGKIPFSEKIGRAYEAGALGVVIVNNEEGNIDGPISGDKSYPIPGIFISLEQGHIIKEGLKQGDVTVDFNSIETIGKPRVIDTVAEFSSRGPRVFDSVIKPEISAPGVDVLSAQWGSGEKGVFEWGTSMSSPHVAGVVALLRQYRKGLSSEQIKSLIVNTGSLIINQDDDSPYPISEQGAGRVNAYRAVAMEVVSSRPTISLGHRSINSRQTFTENFQIQNITDHQVTYNLDSIESGAMKISLSPNRISLAPRESVEIRASIRLESQRDEIITEANGFIRLSKGTGTMGFIPVLAIISRSSGIDVDRLVVDSTGLSSSMGRNVEITLSNRGSNEGSAFFFNLLGQDSKNVRSESVSSSYSCDLQSSGYRILNRNGRKFLQVAVKLFDPVNNWRACSVFVEIDYNGDRRSDELLIGAYVRDIPWLKEINHPDFEFGTLAFNMHRAQQVGFSTHSYSGISKMYAFPYSTISILEAPLNSSVSSSDIHLRVAVSFEGVETFNYDLIGEEADFWWEKISLNPNEAGYAGLPVEVELEPGISRTIQIRKGNNKKEALIGYFPRNSFSINYGQDDQSLIPSPVFKTR